MTYGEAVESALKTLNFGTTSYAHDQYDAALLQYANAAVLELTKDSRPVAVDEDITITAGKFLFSDLANAIHSLIRVIDADGNLLRTRADGDQVYTCRPYTGAAKVTYQYYPEYVTTATMNDAEIPLPKQYHQLVPIYIVGQYLLGDAGSDGLARGQAQMQLFSALRRSLHKPENGTTRSHKLRNRGW